MMPPCILVIEDNALNLELVNDLLGAEGFTVLTSCTAEEGLRLARERRPDVILMDLSLPGMDGRQAIRVLRSDPATRHLRIVVLTAHAMKGDGETAFLAGADAYLTKPINTRTFGATLRRFVGSPPGPREDALAMNEFPCRM